MHLALIWFVVLGAIGLPAGFMVGWLMGWHEHEQRAREDERAGLCRSCLKPRNKRT